MSETRRCFISSLRQCASALRNNSNTAPLRDLQRIAKSLFYEEQDNSLRALAFVLDEWIKDYYLNFAGDIIVEKWEDIEGIRSQLLSESTASALDSLANSLESGTASILADLEFLVVSYLDAVARANKCVE